MKFEVNLGGIGETLCAEVCDLPGCIAVGADFGELLESLRDNIRLYLGEGTIPDKAATAIRVGVRVGDYPGLEPVHTTLPRSAAKA